MTGKTTAFVDIFKETLGIFGMKYDDDIRYFDDEINKAGERLYGPIDVNGFIEAENAKGKKRVGQSKRAFEEYKIAKAKTVQDIMGQVDKMDDKAISAYIETMAFPLPIPPSKKRFTGPRKGNQTKKRIRNHILRRRKEIEKMDEIWIKGNEMKARNYPKASKDAREILNNQVFEREDIVNQRKNAFLEHWQRKQEELRREQEERKMMQDEDEYGPSASPTNGNNIRIKTGSTYEM
jgi:hypothetical protein